MEITSIIIWTLIISILLLIVHKYCNGPWTPIDPGTNLKDKIIIVTGSTKGIGKETALVLLEKGAKVIFACRDEINTNCLINSIENLKMR